MNLRGTAFLLPKTPQLDNIQLNVQSRPRCSRCGRRYPETLVNADQVLREGVLLRCIDRTRCDAHRKQP